MLRVGVLDAKNNLSSLLREVESGREECVVITRHDRPVAHIVPASRQSANRRIGFLKGREVYCDGWDDPAFNEEIADMLLGGACR